MPKRQRFRDAKPPESTRLAPSRRPTRWWLLALGVVAILAGGAWGIVHAVKAAQTRAALAALSPVAGEVPPEQPERRAAMELADRLLQEFPDSPEALYARGTLLVRHGFNEEAAKTWKACLHLVPDLAPAYEFLGIEAFQRGEPEQAVAYLSKAVQLDPQSPAAGLYLGQALNDLGRMREAIPVLERFLTVSPHTAEPYFQLGQAHLYLEDYAQAKEYHQAALREDPGFAQACFGVAQACERLGETDKAKEYRERHVTLIAQGRKAEQRRVRSGRSATEAREALAGAYETVAKIYQAHGRTEEAQQLRRKAAGLDPPAAARGVTEGGRPRPSR